MEALSEVGSSGPLGVRFELARKFWQVSRQLTKLLRKASIVEGAAKALRDGVSDLGVAVLGWLLVSGLLVLG